MQWLRLLRSRSSILILSGPAPLIASLMEHGKAQIFFGQINGC